MENWALQKIDIRYAGQSRGYRFIYVAHQKLPYLKDNTFSRLVIGYPVSMLNFSGVLIYLHIPPASPPKKNEKPSNVRHGR